MWVSSLQTGQVWQAAQQGVQRIWPRLQQRTGTLLTREKQTGHSRTSPTACTDTHISSPTNIALLTWTMFRLVQAVKPFWQD